MLFCFVFFNLHIYYIHLTDSKYIIYCTLYLNNSIDFCRPIDDVKKYFKCNNRRTIFIFAHRFLRKNFI